MSHQVIKSVDFLKIFTFSHQWKVALDENDPHGSGLRLRTFASSTPTYLGFPSDLR